ncbi:MAG: ATP:cob(I)alamin adenosyltransferase [Bryobacterales bacterium]|nr:ATP:cob(I)alamin adenosyltransferase [Bryobacterales bacterium]
MGLVETFNEPRIAINRVYTRRGDAGETGLVGGQRVRKDDPRIECYGTVDELNSFIGLARGSVEGFPSLSELAVILKRVQHELFNAGSILATLPPDVHPKQPRVTDAEVARLEAEIDGMNAILPPLRSFVLPGGSRANADLHVCRTVCRRAERLCASLEDADHDTLKYLNRLSDALFVWSRWVNHQLGVPETLWEPNEAASAHS